MSNQLKMLWICFAIALPAMVALAVTDDVSKGTSTIARRLPLAAMLCLPPLAIALFTMTCLFNMHPTVQGNTGSSEAMAWWSCWATWWPTVGRATLFQIVLYIATLIVCCFRDNLKPYIVPSILALACSLMASFIIVVAAPRA
jgi:hypothetical protein